MVENCDRSNWVLTAETEFIGNALFNAHSVRPNALIVHLQSIVIVSATTLLTYTGYIHLQLRNGSSWVVKFKFRVELRRVVGSSALVSKGNIVDVFVVTIVLKCLGESWVWADVSHDWTYDSSLPRVDKPVIRERQSVEEVEEAVARMPGRMIRRKMETYGFFFPRIVFCLPCFCCYCSVLCTQAMLTFQSASLKVKKCKGCSLLNN